MLALPLAFLLTGCAEKGEDYQFENAPASDSSEAEASQPEERSGEAIYNQYCANCHGAEGMGVPNVGPSLLDKLEYPDEEIIGTMLNGFGTMPSIPISREEATAVLDYMREHF
ncbi:MAG: cytochrome c [Myxococcota bacterium]|nr:cytochrome c [Myxococcota bacterium]